MYVGIFVIILNGIRGNFFCCLLAFYLSNENSFQNSCTLSCQTAGRANMFTCVSTSSFPQPFQTVKLINTFLINLNVLSMSIPTKISRKLLSVSSACRIKVTPEKEERWTKYLYWTFTFCNHSLLSLTQYPTQGLCF